ncbi:PAS domain S-box protein [Spirosoma flavum]|uniref:histidine kinase n=1 Tax=Spirosoma flavum TaxID=2048557 RepID=A0ABW6ALE7_9BACT
MKKNLQVWFNTSLSGVAFVEPIFSPQGIITVFRYKQVNTAFAKMLGRTQDELIGQPIRGFFPSVPETELVHQLLTVSQTGEPQQLHQHDRGLWLTITLTRAEGQIIVNVQDVSEQKETEQKLRRRLAMESIISSVASRLLTLDAREMDSYCVEALEQISTHIGADRALVFLYSDDYLRGSCIHEWYAPDISSRKDEIQNVLLTQYGWIHQQLQHGQLILVGADTLPPEAIREKAHLATLVLHSVILVPLIQQDKTQGFVGFYTTNKSQSWDHNDISLLKTFSTLIANVLHRFLQETALRRANQRLEGLHAIDRALLSYRSIDQSPLLTAMKYVHLMVPCDRITVFQFDKATGLAVAKCRVVEGELNMNPAVAVSARYFYEQFPPNQGADQFIYNPDLPPDSAGIIPELNIYGQGFRSLLIVPLYSRNECIGAFVLGSFSTYFFTEEHRQIAQELASSLAIVLYQQQLNEQLKEYTEQLEQRVEERTSEIRQLSTLHQAILRNAGQAIISTNIDGVIQTANQACEGLLGYTTDELIGRVVRLEQESPEKPIRLNSYKSLDLAGPPSALFLSLLKTKGYLDCECLTSSKKGQLMPLLLAASVLLDEDETVIGYVAIATDISALKIAEEKLKKTNKELNTFFEGAIDLHAIIGLEGNILTVNRACERTLGYVKEELTAMTFWELIHPDEREPIRQLFKEVLNNQPLRNQISQFQKKDGAYGIMEWNAVRIDQLIYASARDITEQQKAEIQLRSLNQRLQLATKAAGQGVWEVDVENDRLILDERVREIYGLPSGRTDFSFQDFLTIVHPDDLSAFLERYNQHLSGDTISNVTRVVRSDGEVCYIKISGIIIRNEQGNAIRHVGVVWDVTEQNLSEKSLRESEQRFREIADNVDEVFWIHSVEPFDLLYINSAYERMFGIASPHTDDMNSFLETVLVEDQAMLMTEFNKYRQGQEVTVQFRIQGTHTEVRWLQIQTFVMKDSQEVPVRHIGIVNDITLQKEKELVLQQALHREQELNQLKSQFVATASHEFRTPLATMQSSVDLIKLYMDLPAASARVSVEKHLVVIEKEINHFSGLLTDILTIGTIESGKVSFNPRRVNIVSICEEIIATHFSQQHKHRSVRLLLEGTPCPVYLDDKLISHVIVNLLTNAFKFSTNAPCLRIIFEDDHLLLQIIDEGIGIPARELSTLFQAFFRASNTSGIPGTGLGLVIARQFVELHGGHLTIASEEGQGTTCTVTVPTDCVDEERLLPVTDFLSSPYIPMITT